MILNFTLDLAGQTGIKPRFIYFDTNDTVATVTTAGFLNKFVEQGNKLSETDMAVVSTRATPNAREASVNLFNVTFSGGDWSLTANTTPLTLLHGLIFIGNSSDVATGVTLSGDATIADTGILTIANSAITNAKVSASAGIQFSKLESLTDGNIIVGSALNVPQQVAMLGDATIDNTGLVEISAGAVTLSKLATDVAPAAIIVLFDQRVTVGGGTVEVFSVPGAVGFTDRAFVQVVDSGTNNVTVTEAVVTNDTLQLSFSADPGNDCVFNYQLIRATS